MSVNKAFLYFRVNKCPPDGARRPSGTETLAWFFFPPSKFSSISQTAKQPGNKNVSLQSSLLVFFTLTETELPLKLKKKPNKPKKKKEQVSLIMWSLHWDQTPGPFTKAKEINSSNSNTHFTAGIRSPSFTHKAVTGNTNNLHEQEQLSYSHSSRTGSSKARHLLSSRIMSLFLSHNTIGLVNPVFPTVKLFIH